MYLRQAMDLIIPVSNQIKENLCINLTDYSAKALFPQIFNGVNAAYMEYPYKLDGILGHTMQDELGLSVTVNSNITDKNRKLFTQAHELGHIVLHRDFLSKSNLPVEFQKNITQNATDEIEHEANWFAANLLLPSEVVYAHIIEGHTAKQIKHFANVSVESTLYRIANIIKKLYWITDQDFIESLVKQYKSCNHKSEVKSSCVYALFTYGNQFEHLDRPGALGKVENDRNLVNKLQQNIELSKRIQNSTRYGKTFGGLESSILGFI